MKIIYTCPDCEYDLREENGVYICDNCKWRSDEAIVRIPYPVDFPSNIWEKYKEYLPTTINSSDYASDPCKNCPNNPANGGSGICHCILGLPKVTC